MKVSKRKMESYRRAELVARELRHQLGGRYCDQDFTRVMELLIYWMRVTGNIKFERPDINDHLTNDQRKMRKLKLEHNNADS